MPLTVPAGSAIVAWEFAWLGDRDPMIVTAGARSLGATFNLADVNRLMQAWRTHILPQQTNAITLTKVTARLSDGAGGFSIIEAIPSTTATGGRAVATLPQNVALLVHKNTARAGRRGRGRMFIPSVAEADVDTVGDLNSAAKTAWGTALNGFLAALDDPVTTVPIDQDPVELLLFHGNSSTTTRTSSGSSTTVTTTEGAAGPAPDVITQLTVDPVVGTQRRRLR